MVNPLIRNAIAGDSFGYDQTVDLGLDSVFGDLLPGSASGSPTLLLDAYPGAAAAYSLRKLRSAYSGAAIRVRRSSDNAEADIGFSGNALDTSALLAHVGAGDGFVAKWYNQGSSGSSEDQVQATAGSQPQVVNSGSVITRGGFPAIKQDLSTDTIGAGTLTKVGSDTVFVVIDVGAATSVTIFSSYDASGNNYCFAFQSGSSSTILNSNCGSPTIFTDGVLFEGTTRGALYSALSGGVRMASVININTNTSNFPDAYGWNAGLLKLPYFRAQYLFEVIRWGGDASSDRAAIDSAIKSNYGIA